MEKWRKGWKLIRRDTRGSVYIGERARGCVVYPLNRITTPQPGCGPLAVFRAREQAEKFLWPYRNPFDGIDHGPGRNPYLHLESHVVRCEYRRHRLHGKGVWYVCELNRGLRRLLPKKLDPDDSPPMLWRVSKNGHVLEARRSGLIPRGTVLASHVRCLE